MLVLAHSGLHNGLYNKSTMIKIDFVTESTNHYDPLSIELLNIYKLDFSVQYGLEVTLSLIIHENFSWLLYTLSPKNYVAYRRICPLKLTQV